MDHRRSCCLTCSEGTAQQVILSYTYLCSSSDLTDWLVLPTSAPLRCVQAGTAAADQAMCTTAKTHDIVRVATFCDELLHSSWTPACCALSAEQSAPPSSAAQLQPAAQRVPAWPGAQPSLSEHAHLLPQQPPTAVSAETSHAQGYNAELPCDRASIINQYIALLCYNQMLKEPAQPALCLR